MTSTENLREVLDNILRDDSPPKKISICFRGDAQKFYSNPNHPTDKKLKCKYFLKGFCQKGSNCLYEHVKPPASSYNSKYKTTLCEQYQKGQECKFGTRCNFAHGQRDLIR